MCGIGAVICPQPVESIELVATCRIFSDGMNHRGPDDSGYVFFREDGTAEAFVDSHSDKNLDLPDVLSAKGKYIAAFVHRRLSIVGVGPGGHQPMQSENGRYWICFNGEVFNFREINHQNGFSSKSGTDTETILKLFEKSGEKNLELLDGFFAGIVYDTEQKKFIIFRDTTGVKPLFFSTKNKTRYFCSETRPLRQITGYDSVNPATIFHLLTEGVLGDIENKTLFSGIREHSPGDVGEFTWQDGYTLSSWKLKRFTEPPVQLAAKLEASVNRRLMADVPLGFAVSGGIDSAAIIGLARKKLGKDAPLKLFSITSSDPASDESVWQKKVAEFNHAEIISEEIENAGLDSLEKLNLATDMPAVAWNNIAHFNLCRLAKSNGVTVLFNGQGADEIFGGYPDYLQRDWKKISKIIEKTPGHWPLSIPDIHKGWMKFKLLSMTPDFVKRKKFQQSFRGLISPDMMGRQSFLWGQSKLSADKKMEEDYFGKKLWQMLQWEDRNGMANSLESRNPFADDRALASFLKIAFSKKIEGGYTKNVLRKALVDLVPGEVLWRTDKKGFTVPDAALTKKFSKQWEPVFMSSLLDEWSPRENRELLLKQISSNDPDSLRWFFRLVSLSYFLQNLKT